MANEKFEKSKCDTTDHKILKLAHNAVLQNLNPSEAALLLQGKDITSAQRFFAFYTMFKNAKENGGKTLENYDKIGNDFISSFKNRMIEVYAANQHPFWGRKKSTYSENDADAKDCTYLL